MEHQVIIKASRFPQGRHVFVAAVAVILGCFASPAFAIPLPSSANCSGTPVVTCTDATQVEAYKGTKFQNGQNGQTNYTSNGFVNGVGNAIQSTSHTFDTDKLIVTLEQGRTTTFLELKFYTKFDGTELSADWADIFLGKGKTDSFSYAVSLGDQTASGGNNGGLASGLYGTITAKTSQDLWKNTTDIYGGMYQGLDGVWRQSPTVLTGGTKLLYGNSGSAISESSSIGTTATDGAYTNLVDVKIAMKTTDFITMFGNQGLSIFWGTADCSNDPIEAFISYAPTAHVPEPMTMSLFGAGVAGLAAMRRRRKAKAA